MSTPWKSPLTDRLVFYVYTTGIVERYATDKPTRVDTTTHKIVSIICFKHDLWQEVALILTKRRISFLDLGKE
jgi:hypothetical protein